jgi:hypothetical protein
VNVGQAEALAADEAASGQLAVDPAQFVERNRRQVRRNAGGRQAVAADVLLADRPFGDDAGLGHGLAVFQVDVAGPHPRLGRRLGRRSDHRPVREFILKVFADRQDLAQGEAVVRHQGRRLAGAVDLGLYGARSDSPPCRSRAWIGGTRPFSAANIGTTRGLGAS